MVARLIRRTTAEQVAEAVQLAILTGEFARGSRLPPERKLAAMLGVSRPTLREGLNQLVAKGLLVSIPGLGTFVSSQDVAASLETLPGQYLIAAAKQRKIELVRHYLELRRFAFSTAISLACQRSTQDDMNWIEDAIFKIGAIAKFDHDVPAAASQELRAMHVAAERSDSYGFWLLLNHVADFFRVAKNDLLTVMTREGLMRHSQELLRLLKSRDAEGVARYFGMTVAEQDRQLLMALEARPGTGNESGGAAQGGAPVGNTPAGVLPGGVSAICFHTTGEPLNPPTQQGPGLSPVPPHMDVADAGDEEDDRGDDAPSYDDSICAAAAPGQDEAQQEHALSCEPLEEADARASVSDGGENEADCAEESSDPPFGLIPEPLAPRAPPVKGPRCDPASWYPNYVDWFRRSFGCSPWDDPREQPPGDEMPEFTRG